MSIIKVTLQSTAGEEISGLAQLCEDGTVILPARLCARLDDVISDGDGYILSAWHNGQRRRLRGNDRGSYLLDEGEDQDSGVAASVVTALCRPTKEQRLAYGRLSHTLTAAATVGLASCVSGWSGWSMHALSVMLGLIAFIVASLLIGASFSRGGE